MILTSSPSTRSNFSSCSSSSYFWDARTDRSLTRSLVPSVSYSSGLSPNPYPLVAPPGKGGDIAPHLCQLAAVVQRAADLLREPAQHLLFSGVASYFSLSTVMGLTSPRTAAILLAASDSLTPE